MERVLSDEEKLRRAIEISQRRNNHYRTANVKEEKVISNRREYKLFKRMIIQIIICLVIYGTFYIISNKNYLFSSQVINKTNSILNYDINLKEWYEKNKKEINAFISKWKEQNKVDSTQNKEKSDSNLSEINTNNAITDNSTIQENSKIEENNSTLPEEENNSKKDLSQMEKDAIYIKSNYIFSKPVKGKVSSRFGEREVLIKNMTENHKGIDIAAKQGTRIKAAIEGQVVEASQNGKYGNFIKIKTDNVLTVYAHCKKLKVKKGDKVEKGDVIAKVGSTGVATGPHLHFEIRLSGRYINPELIINF